MSKILLDQPHRLPGILNMAVTPKCYGHLAQMKLSPVAFLQELTKQDILIFVQTGDRRSLYCRQGSFFVEFTEGKVVLLTAFHENTLRSNNNCLRYGVSIRCEQGLSMSIKIQRENVYRTFHNGRPVENQPNSPRTTEELARLLNEEAKIASAPRTKAPAAENDLPSETKDYLELAQTYAEIEDNLEKAKAQQGAPLRYYKIEAAQDHDRQDRIAYTVYTDFLDDTEYAVQKKVQLELPDGQAPGATVLAAEHAPETNSPGGYLTLLFDDQIALSSLPQMGTVRPSYSDVQFQVRKKVIENLYKRKGKAAFLEHVLGPYQTAGFENKDLRALDAALKKQKYPPNPSQVEAIHRGINTKDIMLVMGPPGTGKTTVILEWVKYFILQEGKRVLISSQNNKAVDNVLERLTEEKEISAIRAGNESKVQANMYPYLLENRIKDLQNTLQQTGAENLARLETLRQEYAGYSALVNSTSSAWECACGLAEELRSTVDRMYADRIRQWELLTAEHHTLQQKLKKSKAGLRRAERFIGETGHRNFLHKLLSPFRGLFRKRAGKLLAKYEGFYESYLQNRESRRKLYREFETMTSDERLTGLAFRLADSEVQVRNYGNALCVMPQDEDVWPELPRQAPAELSALLQGAADGRLTGRIARLSSDPSSPDALSEKLRALSAMLSPRIQRTEALIRCVEKWNEHISAQNNYALSDLLMESVDLVGGTCIGINSQRKFADIDFDVTIIDEAGQIQIHNALVPMSRSPKVIMLGDHKQIPPIADPEQVAMCQERGVDSSLLETSLFERLYNNLPEQNRIMLDKQYRMPSQLGDLLSEWFYEGKYYSFEGKMGMPGVCPRLFHSPFVVVDTSQEPNRKEYKPEMGAGNHLEAELVALIVACLTDPNGPDAMDADQFGVISPYGEQVENMRQKIRKRAKALDGTQIREMVASLDSFQGQERKIILYSCTRSNSKSPEQPRIGFLKELRRLNVALSRPKEQLVFIGDMEFLAGCKNGSGTGSEQEFSAFIRLMMQHAAKGGEIITAAELRRRAEAYYG